MFHIGMYVSSSKSVDMRIHIIKYEEDFFHCCQNYYCETHKTVNTRNIYGMLSCFEK